MSKPKTSEGNTNTTTILAKQKAYFSTDATKPIDFRLHQLKKLKSLCRMYENDILQALSLDLGRHPLEGYVSEIMLVINEINYCIKKLKQWTKVKSVKSNFFLSPSKSKIYYEPFGATLIISPWNYPFLLSMRPLLGAVCAGNCVTLKCSEFSLHTSKVIIEMINQHFPEEYLYASACNREETDNLIQSGYDFILYSGDNQSGKNVMKLAADTLSPIVLTLGGKSPVIVDETANIPHAAKRIVWGKYINAGQACLAPAFVFVHISRKNELIREIENTIKKFYGDEPLLNPDYGKIINLHHFQRLKNLLPESSILLGGKSDESTLKMEPTVVELDSLENKLMQEDIFGPILPILTYKDLDILISQLKNMPKPLSLYHFSKHKASIQKVNQSLSFGGGCVNDCVIHSTNKYFPFGGIGSSGFGAYGGEQGFKTFSHTKAIIERKRYIIADLMPITPVYTEAKFKFFKMFARLIGY
jgi:aldehyde dehydrogenase (NAD+)